MATLLWSVDEKVIGNGSCNLIAEGLLQVDNIYFFITENVQNDYANVLHLTSSANQPLMS